MIGTAYRVSKFMALVGLPFLGVVYFALAGGSAMPTEVLGVILEVDLCLGVLLHVSQRKFKRRIARGTMHVSETPRGITYMIELGCDPEFDLPGKKEVRLRVQTRPK